MVKQGKKIKIALVGYKLSGGGLELVLSRVSELLHHSNCILDVIVLKDEIEYPYQGTLVNLGYYSKFRKYLKLKKHLKKNEFDYIIDFRYRINPWMELFFVYYIYTGFKFIYTIHSSKLEVYLTSIPWVAQKILNKSYKIVAVSHGLNQKIKTHYQFNNGVVIPNSIAVKETSEVFIEAHLNFEYCIAVGRLVELKQFDKLIATYCKSDLAIKKIHLVILGEGQEKERLQEKIEQFKMNDFIHLLGYKKNTFHYIKNAQFLILCSKHEGFPMVILESLFAETPVVSFDCQTGPRELLQNEYNGLLVEDQNFEALEQALQRMAIDDQLYYNCKKNARGSVHQFSNERCAEKWLNLLNTNTI